MKKSDLEYGNVVEVRDGTRFLYQKSKVIEPSMDFISLSDGRYWLSLYYLTDDLKARHRICDECDIMKVYKDYTCKELLWERKEKEKVKLTEDEKVILRNLPKEYKYIARQKYGELAVYQSKPYKDNICGYWEYYENSMRKFLSLYNHLFQFIKWEDEESYLIEDLLKGEEK